MKRVEYTLQSLDRILARNPDAADAPDAPVALRRMVLQMAADGNPRRTDPMREILARLGDKWSPLLMIMLRTGSFRHATLRRLVGVMSTEGEISQRMLTLRLRALERDGLIARRVLSTTPAAVMYSLTDAGHGLVAHLDALLAWTRTHADAIRAAQARFSATRSTAAERPSPQH
jgi:DNA-binding HxlR family transcriptional regulator